jgi:hypothetical protein
MSSPLLTLLISASKKLRARIPLDVTRKAKSVPTTTQRKLKVSAEKVPQAKINSEAIKFAGFVDSDKEPEAQYESQSHKGLKTLNLATNSEDEIVTNVSTFQFRRLQ